MELAQVTDAYYTCLDLLHLPTDSPL